MGKAGLGDVGVAIAHEDKSAVKAAARNIGYDANARYSSIDETSPSVPSLLTIS